MTSSSEGVSYEGVYKDGEVIKLKYDDYYKTYEIDEGSFIFHDPVGLSEVTLGFIHNDNNQHYTLFNSREISINDWKNFS